MTGISKNREPPAAAAVFVFEGEDEVNLANAVAEEQLRVGLGAPKLAILDGRKDEITYYYCLEITLFELCHLSSHVLNVNKVRIKSVILYANKKSDQTKHGY